MKLKNKIKLLIAADGGAASGKTTAAKLISKKYDLNFLSSGLLYRYMSYKLIAKKKFINNSLYLSKITNNITLNKLKNNKLFNHKITEYASEIAKSQKIRKLLSKFQKKFFQTKACLHRRS